MKASRKEPLNDPAWAWKPFESTAARPWDARSVAHLHRRAGFAAPWSVLERDLREGPATSIERLLNGEARSADGLPAAELEVTLDAMTAQLGPSADLARIQA